MNKLLDFDHVRTKEGVVLGHLVVCRLVLRVGGRAFLELPNVLRLARAAVVLVIIAPDTIRALTYTMS